ncbi:MAG: hypothetical protein LAT75_06925 [Candidatus Cyclonatronum sp.]|uniref:hypothetical protein n=1 Tax=Cyclonatronum sp. TaxID=3024185 RepID=UPI0025C5BFAF|nr:hypothetical protein [Cyclonatronum sp.]MCH8486581.1 hypothetical protein [Cyclonatronum sp.]
MNALLPASFRKPGWVLFSNFSILGIILLFFQIEPEWLDLTLFAVVTSEPLGPDRWFTFTQTNIATELTATGIIIGGLMLAFSRRETEDEYITRIRLESLVWAVYANYIVLLFAIWFVFSSPFFTVMIVNMFTVLLIFIMRFEWVMFRLSREGSHE